MIKQKFIGNQPVVGHRWLENLLWGTVVVGLGLVFIWSVSDHQKVEAAKDQLKTAQRQADITPISVQNQWMSDPNFDVQQAKVTAQAKLQPAIQLALGGIHSEKQWQAQSDQLNAALGPALAQRLHAFNQRMHWSLRRNQETLITFDTINDPQEMNLTILSIAIRDIGHRIPVLIQLDYDLRYQSVLMVKMRGLHEMHV